MNKYSRITIENRVDIQAGINERKVWQKSQEK